MKLDILGVLAVFFTVVPWLFPAEIIPRKLMKCLRIVFAIVAFAFTAAFLYSCGGSKENAESAAAPFGSPASTDPSYVYLVPPSASTPVPQTKIETIDQSGGANAIGGNASRSDSHNSGPYTSGDQSPAIGNLTVTGPGSVGINYGNVTTNQTTINQTFYLTNVGQDLGVKVQGTYTGKNIRREDGKYVTSGTITILSPYAVGNILISVKGRTIQFTPMGFVFPHGAGIMQDAFGQTSDGYWQKIISAFGSYDFKIISDEPEDLLLQYQINAP
jgi:hypothetical protein